MAAYESTSTTRTSTALPADVPVAAEEVGKGIPDGAVFQSDAKDEKGNKRRFRLRHPRTIGAEWVEIKPREKRNGNAK